MAYIWLGSTRHQEAAVGQWVEDPNEPSGWRWDHDAPPGDPTVTQIFNAVPAAAPQRTFTQDDGTTYARASAAEFESFDEVDSTSIVDPGAPA